MPRIRNRSLLPVLTILGFAMLAPIASADDWPMFRYDETHQGSVGTNTEFTVFLQRWWNNISIPATIKGSPVVKDNRAFIGAWDNHLYALDSESGSILWKADTKGKITGTPAVSENTVYVVTESGSMQAYNAKTGVKERETSLGVGTFGSPVVHERRVFVGVGIGNARGKVLAYEGDTLTKIWEFPVAGKYFDVTVADGQVEGSPAVYNGQVLFGSSNQYFYSVSEEGIGGGKTTLTWMFKATGSIRSSPAIDKANSRVLFGAQDGKLYSVPLASTDLVAAASWTLQEEAGPGLPSQIHSSPAVAGDKAFVGVNNGNVIAVSLSSGTRVWAHATPGQVVSSPALANGFVLVGSTDRNIYMLHQANGTVAWSQTNSAAIESSPAIVGTQGFWASTDGALSSWGGVKPQRADLQITAISGSLVVGEQRTLTVAIRNGGQLVAPATNARLFAGSTLVGSVAVIALGPGNSTTASFSFTAASRTAISFRADVDPTNEIREVDESNNIFTRSITPAPAPTQAPVASETGGSPGFEALLLVAAMGLVGFFLRRRRN